MEKCDLLKELGFSEEIITKLLDNSYIAFNSNIEHTCQEIEDVNDIVIENASSTYTNTLYV